MLEVEVLEGGLARGGPPAEEVRRLCDLALGAAGLSEGHLAIEYVTAEDMASLNGRHRGKREPTDVLSFPIDGPELARFHGAPGGLAPSERALAAGDDVAGRDVGEGVAGRDAGAGGGPLELGDVVICPEHTSDLREAIVHGVLHLAGMDHEVDNGEMLALQERVLGEASGR